jgi:hypothetical protein
LEKIWRVTIVSSADGSQAHVTSESFSWRGAGGTICHLPDLVSDPMQLWEYMMETINLSFTMGVLIVTAFIVIAAVRSAE